MFESSKLFRARLQLASETERADIAEERVDELETHLFEIQRDLVSAQNRLGELEILSRGKEIEERIEDATNYEFGLRIMRKQLEDQLLYIYGGDKEKISTIQFESIEEICKNMICFIDVLMQVDQNS